jgi:hypothetical protein
MILALMGMGVLVLAGEGFAQMAGPMAGPTWGYIGVGDGAGHDERRHDGSWHDGAGHDGPAA